MRKKRTEATEASQIRQKVKKQKPRILTGVEEMRVRQVAYKKRLRERY